MVAWCEDLIWRGETGHLTGLQRAGGSATALPSRETGELRVGQGFGVVGTSAIASVARRNDSGSEAVRAVIRGIRQ